LNEEQRLHYGTFELAKRIQAVNPNAITVVATGHVIEHRVDPAEMLSQAQGSIVMFLDKQDIMGKDSSGVRRCVAGLIVAAVARQQAAEAERGMAAALESVGADVRELSAPLADEPFGDEFMIGGSQELAGVARQIQVAATLEWPVFIRGEPGTGKERVARSLHALWEAKVGSKRPFVVAECSSVTHTLFESELFGHVRGAFTGADREKDGFVQEAKDGILFLDEIGDIPPELQKKILRLLEEREYRRVGDTAWKKCKARIVMATNRDLERMIADGEFREDLFGRLTRALRIQTVPLRGAKEAIPAIVRGYVKRESRNSGLPPDLPIDDAVFHELARHDWPNNVRELQGVVIHNLADLCAHGSRKWQKVVWPPESNTGGRHGPPRPRKDTGGSGSNQTAQSETAWHAGVDLRHSLALAREIWTTQGACIEHDPDTILVAHGAPCLRVVLAILKGASRRKFGYRGWKAPFDSVFGFGSGKRASVGLPQYLQNISRQHKDHFAPRAGRAQFGAMDVDDDAEALKEGGCRLDIE